MDAVACALEFASNQKPKANGHTIMHAFVLVLLALLGLKQLAENEAEGYWMRRMAKL